MVKVYNHNVFVPIAHN
ncbi:hypothetical protein E2C01_083906 [Portunus trituberculatus]|uniref:Uncharacterized protein n=2 Tax=Portunus trituberculatus TaxID=210409 RepID=A0A5B7J7T6_PORTR|nr:hypothetical protein [Portunus trituberculatus]